MKSTAVLFAGVSGSEIFEKTFDGKSAFDLAYDWACSIDGCDEVCVFCNSSNRSLVEAGVSSSVKILCQDEWTNSLLIKNLSQSAAGCDALVFAWADCPFLNVPLTMSLLKMHEDYRAEYTFSDGYPYGLAPEVIHGGTLAILKELCDGIQKQVGDRTVERAALFNVMSGDINSFEIETLVAPKDYRMLRFEFECTSRLNRIACQKLFEKAQKIKDPVELCDMAEKSVQVLRTVPAFYNIQISSSYNHDISYVPYKKFLERDGKSFSDMGLDDYERILEKIAGTTPEAVISLSCWGEPLRNKDFLAIVKKTLEYPGLRLFIETDGLGITDELACEIASSADGRIDWCVLLDAVEPKLYARIHGCQETDFEKAVEAIRILEKNFEHHVYPQMTRMKSNEEQLESFYKYWKNKESPAKGNFIIQKYDYYAGFLSDEKSADLSPLNRLPCWHLRRDLVVLADGSVPLCKEAGFSDVIGNLITDSVDDVFGKHDEELERHVTGTMCDRCKACDEYYTFNF